MNWVRAEELIEMWVIEEQVVAVRIVRKCFRAVTFATINANILVIARPAALLIKRRSAFLYFI